MKKSFLIFAAIILLFASCEEEKTEEIKITRTELKGYVQKGPFLNGTSIKISELRNDLSPTGNTFSSQIEDNSGLFQLNNISLTSQYVQLEANGFYFNEITGKNSQSPITLFALSDITDKTTVNVNVLSHLEKSRIEYLLTNGETSFSAAKKQAEKEVLNIFSITAPNMIDADLLNISADGENNAILLAISVITQGFRTEAELSDLLANIKTDLKQDGILNSSALGSLLINDARLLDLVQLRTDLEKRYTDLGLTVTIPNFEKYVKQFIDNSSYTINNTISYPEFSTYGKNILYGDSVDFESGLSLSADLPKGTSLKIIIKGNIWYYSAMSKGPINWTISTFKNGEQTFEATESGKVSDLRIQFETGTYTIEWYENNSLVPTKTKTFQKEGVIIIEEEK